MTDDEKTGWPQVELGEVTMIFNVKDLAKSIDFYTRLGFEQTVVHGHDGENPISSEDNPTWATFRYRNQNVSLMDIGMNMMHFVVDDPPAVMTALTERGLAPQASGPGNTGASLGDPDGNIIYIMKSTP